MVRIILVIFLSTFFLPSAYGMQDQKNLMQSILAELQTHEKFKLNQAADPEETKKTQNKDKFERLKGDIKSVLDLGTEKLIANPDKLTMLFYNFFNLFFDLSFLQFSSEIRFGKNKEEASFFDEYRKLHDAIYKKDLNWDELWINGEFGKLNMQPLQEKLVVALSLLSQTIGKYSDTKYEFLTSFKLSLIGVLGDISESLPYCQKWRKALVMDNEFFKDPKYIFLSTNKEFLAKEFEIDLRLKYVIDAIQVDIDAEIKKAKDLQLKESEEKQRIMDLKKKQYDEFKKDEAQKDKINLTKLCKEYIRILCDHDLSCIFEIVKPQDLDGIMSSFDKLVDSAGVDVKKKMFTELGKDAEISDTISETEKFIKYCKENNSAFKGVELLKKRLKKIKDLIAQESEKKISGKKVVTLQDLQSPLLKQNLSKLKKSLSSLKIKLDRLQSDLKKLASKIK